MISIGSKQLVDCQVGSKKVKKIYKGSKKVWPSWNLLYDADVKAGGRSGSTTLATIPNYVPKTTKIKVVISYISGTWKKGNPTMGSGEQAIQFGQPPYSPYVEFSEDVSPLSFEYNSGSDAFFLSIQKQSDASYDFTNSEWSISKQGQLILNISSSLSSVFSDPIHLQVYYQ